MQGNPYSGIIKLMQQQVNEQIPVSFRFGQVKSVSPLTITISKTDQDGNNLLKNADVGELHSGDNVLLIPFDNDQKFIVLCKVVGV